MYSTSKSKKQKEKRNLKTHKIIFMAVSSKQLLKQNAKYINCKRNE